MNQRSKDMFVGNNQGVFKCEILVHMFAQIRGFEVGEFVHVVADAHIYDRHIILVKELIRRKIYPKSTLIIQTKEKDFYDFTVEDFVLEVYQRAINNIFIKYSITHD